jgi:hypothetical protein
LIDHKQNLAKTFGVIWAQELALTDSKMAKNYYKNIKPPFNIIIKNMGCRHILLSPFGV